MKHRIVPSATLSAAIAIAVAAVAASCEAFTSSWNNQRNMMMQYYHHSYYYSTEPSLRSLPPSSSTSLRLSDEPSDTSSDYFYEDDDDVVIVESESFAPTDAEALVTSVLDLIPSLVAAAAEEKRAEINEALLKLEALNPTPQPAQSPLLNGVWELRYAGLYTTDGALLPFSPTRQVALFMYSGGYTPGLFALALAQSLPSQLVDVGPLGISISREQPRVEGRVTVKSMLLGESSVVVKARLDVVSDIRLRETYESATVLGQNVAIPDLLQYSRELYVTYVDEDLLIIRDASGVPELLVRKEKDFTRKWGTEPTTVDDELAPGEE